MPVLRHWARTDVGKKRPHNEDAYLADESLGLYAVADGMGGHAAGEVASAAALQALRDALAEDRSVLDGFAASPTVESREHAAQLERCTWSAPTACTDISAMTSCPRSSARRSSGWSTCSSTSRCNGAERTTSPPSSWPWRVAAARKPPTSKAAPRSCGAFRSSS